MKKILSAIVCCLLIAIAAPRLLPAIADNSRDKDRGVIAAEVSSASRRMSKKEMARRAELIVVGECTSARSVWIDDGRNLVTLAEFSVSETLKGEGRAAVTVVLPGGVDANRKFPVAMTYPDAPTMNPREQALLFLTNQAEVADGYAIMGAAEGKYSIRGNKQGAEAVGRSLRGMSLPEGDKVVRDGGRLVPLSKLKEEIEGYLRQQ